MTPWALALALVWATWPTARVDYEARSIVATHAPRHGIATVFGYAGDRHAGGAAKYLGRPVNAFDMGIAHRTLPGGTRVLVCYRSCAWAHVIDRGPYGCDLARGVPPAPGQKCHAPREDGSRWCLCKAGLGHPGEYRGELDLTPALARAIGLKWYPGGVLGRTWGRADGAWGRTWGRADGAWGRGRVSFYALER